MKKLLISLIFLFTFFFAKSQDTPPTGADFKTLSTYSFKYYTPYNSKVKSVWMYKGSIYGWTELLGFHRADSLYVPKSRIITTTAPLTIAGTTSANLSADRTIALTMLGDLATTAPVTGAVNDIFPGIDGAKATIGLTVEKDIVTTAPLTVNGTTNLDNIITGADADITLAIIPATTSVAGSMSAADKTKLDGISGTNTGDNANTTNISGTQNYVSKFISATAIGNSLIRDDGTSVGIGMAPVGRFTVKSAGDVINGISFVKNSDATSLFEVREVIYGHAQIYLRDANGVISAKITSYPNEANYFGMNGGNVSIGTTTSPYVFHVVGTTRTGDLGVYNTIGEWETNANAILYMNYSGYNNGYTQFRDLQISNGKAGLIAMFVGSTGNTGFGYADPGTYRAKFNGTGYFSGNLTANAFIKIGGTSAQYLLADGSVTTSAGSVYKGEVDGDDGIPRAGGSALIDGTGTTAWYYACYDAGTWDYAADGSGNSIVLAIGDQLYYNGTIWIKIPGAGSYVLPIGTDIALGGVISNTNVSINASTGGMTVGTNANLTGDVTSLGNATTIGAGKVTLAMMANMATASLIYRKTAGAGVPEVNTLATLKTDLGLTGTNSGDNGTVTSVAALTLGTTGTDLSSSVATGTTTPVITLQVPTASAANRGALSAADWSTFNGKQAAGSYQPLHASLTSIAGLTEAAGTLIYGTADNAYATLAAGATNTILVGGGAAAPVWTPATGTGGPAREGSPTFIGTVTTPVLKVTTGAGLNKVLLSDANGLLSYSASALGTAAYTASGDYATAAQANATHTGDATGATALTVVKINGTLMSGLATGILKNTTTTGVPSIAVAGDFPTLNQNTTGSAATLTTARDLYGFSFNGSAGTVSGTNIIASGYGGTGNGFTKFTGATTSEKTYTLPDANETFPAHGTANNVMLSNGTIWTSAAIPNTHVAATVTTTNGLSISGQEISLGVSSTNTHGALTDTDWNTFNGREPGLGNPGVTGYILSSTTGGLRSWIAPIAYPGAGIAVSTGSAWGSSIADASANWNTAYTHSTDNSQAHSDYLLNSGDDATSGTLTAAYFIGGNFTLTASDSTLKRNIKPFELSDFSKASKIDFKKYMLKADPTNRQHYGSMAQDVELLFPELVYTDLKTGKKTVSYEEILIVKFAAMEEEIRLLKKQVKRLELMHGIGDMGEETTFPEHPLKISKNEN